ncbi:MAG: LVIS_2131 family protein, partial [Lacticaseibacillus paracasei]
ATVTARYKPGFLNGLGMHVGNIADRFSILRVPNDTFVEIDPVKD